MFFLLPLLLLLLLQAAHCSRTVHIERYTLSSSKELLTSAGGDIGGCGTAACFELFALVGRFDIFGEMVGGESTEPVRTDFIRSIRSIRET